MFRFFDLFKFEFFFFDLSSLKKFLLQSFLECNICFFCRIEFFLRFNIQIIIFNSFFSFLCCKLLQSLFLLFLFFRLYIEIFLLEYRFLCMYELFISCSYFSNRLQEFSLNCLIDQLCFRIIFTFFIFYVLFNYLFNLLQLSFFNQLTSLVVFKSILKLFI